MSNCETVAKVKIFVENERFIPKKSHEGDAGYDLFANVEDNAVIWPGQRMAVSAGFKMALPKCYEAQIRPRSGNAMKMGLTVLNTPGTIDCNYRGEVKVILYNSSEDKIWIKPMDKIAQMVINKLPEISIEQVQTEQELGESDRGENGFGSTGTVSNKGE